MTSSISVFQISVSHLLTRYLLPCALSLFGSAFAQVENRAQVSTTAQTNHHENLSFKNKMTELVWPFYTDKAAEYIVSARDGVPLKMVHFENPNARAHVYFLTGVNDTYLRNLETLYDLYNLGYSVTSFDHRSQGFSGRIAKNPQTVYVRQFQDYVDDFTIVYDMFSSSSGALPQLAVSASMGGGILAQFVMQNPDKLQATVYGVPMFGFNTEPYSNFAAFSIANALCIAGKCKDYAPGQTDFKGFPKFEEQSSTHSIERFAFKNELFTSRPELQVAGKSNGWIREALAATQKIRSFKKWGQTPSIVFSAEKEDTVRNDSHEIVCKSQKNCRRTMLLGSFHDIFNEDDIIRTLVMTQIAEFLKTAE